MSRASAILVLVPLGAAAAAVAAAAAGAGCGRRAAPEARQAVRVGALGVAVDAPPGWEVATQGKGSYRVGTGPGEQVVIREIAFPPATVDELYAAECARAIGPGTRAATPAGALLVECRVAQTRPDGDLVELVHVASLIRAGGHGIKCHFGIVGDAEAAAAVCRSLRSADGAAPAR